MVMVEWVQGWNQKCGRSGFKSEWVSNLSTRGFSTHSYDMDSSMGLNLGTGVPAHIYSCKFQVDHKKVITQKAKVMQIDISGCGGHVEFVIHKIKIYRIKVCIKFQVDRIMQNCKLTTQKPKCDDRDVYGCGGDVEFLIHPKNQKASRYWPNKALYVYNFKLIGSGIVKLSSGY